jgi:hypothetical protein
VLGITLSNLDEVVHKYISGAQWCAEGAVRSTSCLLQNRFIFAWLNGWEELLAISSSSGSCSGERACIE